MKKLTLLALMLALMLTLAACASGEKQGETEAESITVSTETTLQQGMVESGCQLLEKEKSTEKIDGAVATIMGLDRTIRCDNNSGESVYDNRGILFIGIIFTLKSTV